MSKTNYVLTLETLILNSRFRIFNHLFVFDNSVLVLVERGVDDLVDDEDEVEVGKEEEVDEEPVDLQKILLK